MQQISERQSSLSTHCMMFKHAFFSPKLEKVWWLIAHLMLLKSLPDCRLSEILLSSDVAIYEPSSLWYSAQVLKCMGFKKNLPINSMKTLVSLLGMQYLSWKWPLLDTYSIRSSTHINWCLLVYYIFLNIQFLQFLSSSLVKLFLWTFPADEFI